MFAATFAVSEARALPFAPTCRATVKTPFDTAEESGPAAKARPSRPSAWAPAPWPIATAIPNGLLVQRPGSVLNPNSAAQEPCAVGAPLTVVTPNKPVASVAVVSIVAAGFPTIGMLLFSDLVFRIPGVVRPSHGAARQATDPVKSALTGTRVGTSAGKAEACAAGGDT